MDLHFYSHAPCGARQREPAGAAEDDAFLLTRPMRGATLIADWLESVRNNFYSHASCEARHAAELIPFFYEDFYSHASCEARPAMPRHLSPLDGISTHTPLARRDLETRRKLRAVTDFYSHASCEARLPIPERIFTELLISTHTPLARRDITGLSAS